MFLGIRRVTSPAVFSRVLSAASALCVFFCTPLLALASASITDPGQVSGLTFVYPAPQQTFVCIYFSGVDSSGAPVSHLNVGGSVFTTDSQGNLAYNPNLEQFVGSINTNGTYYIGAYLSGSDCVADTAALGYAAFYRTAADNNTATPGHWSVTPSTGGTLSVTTNLPAATFSITGPANYASGGTSFTASSAPAGTYTITYISVAGYPTPPKETKTLSAHGLITFRGGYVSITDPGQVSGLTFVYPAPQQTFVCIYFSGVDSSGAPVSHLNVGGSVFTTDSQGHFDYNPNMEQFVWTTNTNGTYIVRAYLSSSDCTTDHAAVFSYTFTRTATNNNYGTLGHWLITPAVVLPSLTVSPLSLSFSYEERSAGTIVPQTLLISSSPLLLNFTVSVHTTDGGAWLSATPISGTTLSLVTVNVDANLKGRATPYIGTITIAAPDSANSPQTISVSLTVIPVPVILVHGYCSDPSAFADMGTLLTSAGVTMGAPFDYQYHTKIINGGLDFSIQELASLFSAHVRSVLDQSQAEHVEVVAHSMGGLIARAWMTGLVSGAAVPYSRQIRRLISLASPYYGVQKQTFLDFLDATRASLVGYDCSNTQEDELLFGSSFISTLNDTWLATNPIDPHNLAFIVGTNGINSLLLECGGESQGCTDGLVDISSAVLPIPPPPLLDISGQMIRYVPYKHASDLLPPSTYAIEAPTNDQHLTFRLVRDFLQSGSLPTQSSLGYLPPHLRGDSSRYEGLLLLGLTNGNTGLPLANANAPRLTFTPVQAKSAYANFLNSDSGALTVWGLAAQTYTDVNIEVDPSGKARKIDGDVVNVSINTARPTVIGSVVLK